MQLPLRATRPSPAMVVAFVALSVALAGTATALPGRSKVKKDDIAKNAVLSKHLRQGNVRRSDIGRDAISSSRVGADALTGADVLESSLSKVGSAQTADSAPISKLVYRSSQFTVLGNDHARGSASCDSGFNATGGGVRTENATTSGTGVRVQSTFPNGLDKWDAEVYNGAGSSATFVVWVVCAPAATTG